MGGGPFLPGERGAGTSVPEHTAVVFLLLYMYKEQEEPELAGYIVTLLCPTPAALGLACLPASRRSSPQGSPPLSLQVLPAVLLDSGQGTGLNQQVDIS